MPLAKSSVRKNQLVERISEEGYHSVVPCDRCVRLKRVCVRADCSDRCGDCVKGGGGVKCEMSNPTFTDAEWRRLVKSQNSLEEEEEAILAKLLRLRKQKRLLQKRAGDFIARDYKEIAELEELERREAEERDRLEKERVESEQKECEAGPSRAASESNQRAFDVNRQILAATSDNPSLTQMIASTDPSSSVFWDDLDAFLVAETVKSPSPVGGTVEPAGGSPSGSR